MRLADSIIITKAFSKIFMKGFTAGVYGSQVVVGFIVDSVMINKLNTAFS